MWMLAGSERLSVGRPTDSSASSAFQLGTHFSGLPSIFSKNSTGDNPNSLHATMEPDTIG